MRASYCYLPILPARWGQFRAVSATSPLARSRMTPLFDVPAPVLKEGKTLEGYLDSRAEGICRGWGADRPVYIDVYNFPLDVRTEGGVQPITYLAEQLHRRGASPIPVTGSVVDRGEDYLQAVRRMLPSLGHGVCLRLDRDEISEPELLRTCINSTLDLLGLDPASTDLVLDFRYVGQDRPDVLRATVLEALSIVSDVGPFRNVAIAGGSVPEQLTKRDPEVRREKRIEFRVWCEVIAVYGEALAISDFGVVSPLYVPPAKVVNPPARVRYTAAEDHLFLRAKRADHGLLCQQVITFPEYNGPEFSVGDQRIALAANGLTGPGTPASWVADDTNHHLEYVTAQVWSEIEVCRVASRFALPVPVHQPWLQQDLLKAE